MLAARVRDKKTGAKARTGGDVSHGSKKKNKRDELIRSDRPGAALIVNYVAGTSSERSIAGEVLEAWKPILPVVNV